MVKLGISSNNKIAPDGKNEKAREAGVITEIPIKTDESKPDCTVAIEEGACHKRNGLRVVRRVAKVLFVLTVLLLFVAVVFGVMALSKTFSEVGSDVEKPECDTMTEKYGKDGLGAWEGKKEPVSSEMDADIELDDDQDYNSRDEMESEERAGGRSGEDRDVNPSSDERDSEHEGAHVDRDSAQQGDEERGDYPARE